MDLFRAMYCNAEEKKDDIKSSPQESKLDTAAPSETDDSKLDNVDNVDKLAKMTADLAITPATKKQKHVSDNK